MSKVPYILNPENFFREEVAKALQQCGIEAIPMISEYLVGLLQFYMDINNLYEEGDPKNGGKKLDKTLAERFFMAHSSTPHIKKDLLKRLGDSSLYISGFFGDSLKRKVVDIDYYASIGGLAYGSLAAQTHEDTIARVYDEFANRFLNYVDVLTVISQQASIQPKEDILRLYDKYIATGSNLAKEQLIEMGMLNVSDCKKSCQ